MPIITNFPDNLIDIPGVIYKCKLKVNTNSGNLSYDETYAKYLGDNRWSMFYTIMSNVMNITGGTVAGPDITYIVYPESIPNVMPQEVKPKRKLRILNA